MPNQEFRRFGLTRATLATDDNALMTMRQHQCLVSFLRHAVDVRDSVEVSVMEVLQRHVVAGGALHISRASKIRTFLAWHIPVQSVDNLKRIDSDENVSNICVDHISF